MTVFERILAARGLDKDKMAAFLMPDYYKLHDPFLMPDMKKAVRRLEEALERQEKLVIYGDYDIDGLTATSLLKDALSSFGFVNVDTFMPNRFVEGYGLNMNAIERIASDGARLIVTVDCGSRSHAEIEKANELGVDVIVTDHHEAADVQPMAVGVINPKRADSEYPFRELAGVGVVFKLVQAMQELLNKGNPSTRPELSFGQEKWLLDLVALGTVCDVVPLIGENRTLVYWGLKVLARTKRPGLKALMAVAGVEDGVAVNARSLGFGLGPRMNAAGRLETAQHSLDLLLADDKNTAIEMAGLLDDLNMARRAEQQKILKEAIEQAEEYANDNVLVLSNQDWNHGVVGIVASKLLEKYKKPVYIFNEMGEESKGSARSFGDFSAVAAIDATRDLITAGGGHKLAAGVTLPTKNIDAFRKRVNHFYDEQELINQHLLLLPSADTIAKLEELDEGLIELVGQLEPFGNGNPQPVLKSEKLIVIDIRRMGSDAQHLKLSVQDKSGQRISLVAFNAHELYAVNLGDEVDVWYNVTLNEWQGRRSVEGMIVHLEKRKD